VARLRSSLIKNKNWDYRALTAAVDRAGLSLLRKSCRNQTIVLMGSWRMEVRECGDDMERTKAYIQDL
jgi:hypothetical protein